MLPSPKRVLVGNVTKHFSYKKWSFIDELAHSCSLTATQASMIVDFYIKFKTAVQKVTDSIKLMIITKYLHGSQIS